MVSGFAFLEELCLRTSTQSARASLPTALAYCLLIRHRNFNNTQHMTGVRVVDVETRFIAVKNFESLNCILDSDPSLHRELFNVLVYLSVVSNGDDEVVIRDIG